jgi:hypothetical protein
VGVGRNARIEKKTMGITIPVSIVRRNMKAGVVLAGAVKSYG